jgi:hypothetical protein
MHHHTYPSGSIDVCERLWDITFNIIYYKLYILSIFLLRAASFGYLLLQNIVHVTIFHPSDWSESIEHGTDLMDQVECNHGFLIFHTLPWAPLSPALKTPPRDTQSLGSQFLGGFERGVLLHGILRNHPPGVILQSPGRYKCLPKKSSAGE